MYSTSELCGNADLVRRTISKATECQLLHQARFSAGQGLQDLNAQPTVAHAMMTEALGSQKSATADAAASIFVASSANVAQSQFFMEPNTTVQDWLNLKKPIDAVQTSAATLHQPVPLRPMMQDFCSHAQNESAACLLFKWPPAHALADLTNKDRGSGYMSTDAEFEAEDDEADQAEDLSSPFHVDENMVFRRYDSDPLAAYCLSDPEARVLLPHSSLGTLGSDDSSYSTFLPR
jgi:hypothetical protein